ncbi:hypothetical protein NC653_040883 [Populus alba x Populus x berolinensis]|uniref:Uncharacterized protein n=1 Tax=Populus alba x Populus x berolinensis TaxID=444605 RepID=A0AAD6L750_9ROSI|nr:hypothetical protein NC653_040883 [Populus alba x Populus x berolinensis]
MKIYSYLLAFIIFHGMILSQTSCMVNVSLGRLSPPPPPKSSPTKIQPSPRRGPKSPHPPPRRLPPSKVNDGHHPSLPPPPKILPPPHTYGSPRYSPPPQRS